MEESELSQSEKDEILRQYNEMQSSQKALQSKEVIKVYEQKVAANPILQEKYKKPTLVNGNFHMFLKLFFIVAIVMFLAFLLYFIAEDKFKATYSNVVNIPERSVNITNDIDNNITKINYYNFTIINRIYTNTNGTV